MLNIKILLEFPDEYKKKSLAFIIFIDCHCIETINGIFPDIAIDGEISNNFINNNFFILSKLEKKIISKFSYISNLLFLNLFTC